jgi:hypothetical protein
LSWPTTTYNGAEYWMFDGITLVPVDPTTGVAILMLKPSGASIASGIPAIAKGEDGDPAEFQEGPLDSFTELDYDDPTPASLEIVKVSPGLYTLSGALHAGAPGEDGSTAIDVETIDGDAVAGKLIKLNSELDGFEFAYEAIGECYRPASINNTSSGNTNNTLCAISVPAQNRAWRPLVVGSQNVVQSGGSDVVVDLVARLNNESAGNIVARCHGIGGTERLTFASCPAAGSNDSFDKVSAGDAATIYIRVEKQGGTNSFTTSSSTARFQVWAIPVG